MHMAALSLYVLMIKRPKRDDGSSSLLPKGGSILSSFQVILEGVEPFSTKKERGK